MATLGKDDLRTICDALGDVKTKWFAIGIQLGIPRNKLLEFEEDRDPLSAVVDYWLSGNVAKSAVPISWKSIVTALRSKYVGELALADEISKKYCQLQEDTKDEKANGTTGQQSSDAKVKIDRNVNMDLEIILERNVEEVIVKYADYVNCILAIVKEKGVSPENLRSYLLTLPAFNSQRLALLSDKKSELKEQHTINEIFDFLSTECTSFMNYNIFQAIMKKYNIPEDREELKYYDHLKAYCLKHTCSEFSKVNPLEKEKEGSKPLILKFDIEMTCRLAKIDDLKKVVAKILDLTSSTLEIVDIEDGSIIVTFLIPASVADALFTADTKFTSQQEEEFREASVQWMKCNGYTFNFGEEAHTEDPAAALKRLKEQLTCSICLSTYTNPKLLQCFHSNCQHCLQGLVQQGQQGRLNLTCPTCRQVTPVPASGVAGLQVDFRTNQLLEVAGKDQKKIVPERVAVASPEKVENVSAPTLTPQQSSTAYCPEHSGKQLEIFCETCMVSICLKCVMKRGKHRKHDCEELDIAFEECKVEVSSILTKLDKYSDMISKEQMKTEADLHSAITLDVRKIELIGQLHQLTESKLQTVAVQRDQLETTQAQLSRPMQSMTEMNSTKMKSSLVQQVKRVISSVPDKDFITDTDSTLVDIIAQWKDGLVSAEPPDPSKCYTIGKDELKTEVGEKITCLLQTVDTSNQPCCVAVNSITCKLVSESEDDVLQGSVERRGESQFEISFQPIIPGNQHLHVKVEGQHIMGSPFSVHVWKSAEEKLITPILSIIGVQGPTSVAVNQRGEMVVAEGCGPCVTMFSSNGMRLRSFGSFNTDKDYNPGGVTLDSEGNVFVADRIDHNIQKFTEQGQLIAIVKIVEGSDVSDYIRYPCDAAFNASNGRVYVLSVRHVAILNSDDLSTYGAFGERGSGEGQFDNPEGISCDSTGNVYVADQGNHRIQVFTAEGKFLRVIRPGVERGGEELWSPVGVAVDSSGRVYASTQDNYIDVFSVEGQLLISFGGLGSEPGQFSLPHGLAVDSSGVFYACDFLNDRIQLFKISFAF